jgi:hypothetical protein
MFSQRTKTLLFIFSLAAAQACGQPTETVEPESTSDAISLSRSSVGTSATNVVVKRHDGQERAIIIVGGEPPSAEVPSPGDSAEDSAQERAIIIVGGEPPSAEVPSAEDSAQERAIIIVGGEPPPADVPTGSSTLGTSLAQRSSPSVAVAGPALRSQSVSARVQ